MKRIALALLASAVALPAGAAPPPAATPVHTITYETGPCFGSCAVYRVRIASNGAGMFEGIRFTAVTGTRRFHASPAQYRAFARALAADRPAQGERRYDGPPLCREMATDQGSVQIVWRGATEQRLDVYYGCDMERNRAMFDRLVAAPGLLPIRDFIRRRR